MATQQRTHSTLLMSFAQLKVITDIKSEKLISAFIAVSQLFRTFLHSLKPYKQTYINTSGIVFMWTKIIYEKLFLINSTVLLFLTDV